MPGTNNTCLSIDILQEEEEKIASHLLGQKVCLVIRLSEVMFLYIMFR